MDYKNILQEAKEKKLLIIFYLEDQEKYGRVLDFFDAKNHDAESIAQKFNELKESLPTNLNLKIGLDGDHIK